MRLNWLWLAVLVIASNGLGQQAAPVLFFSDLTSGPVTGNSDSTYTAKGGAYVTLYGNFFGANQGTSNVTLNGANCLKVISWGAPWLWYQKMVVQLTSACTTGNFVVTTSAGTSNGVAFTVTSGKIYYVATSGKDGNSVTFRSPWRTLPHAVQTAGTAKGNIVYVESNVQQTTSDGQWKDDVTIRARWSMGTSSQPDALIGYPGAKGIQLGNSSLLNYYGFGTSDFTAGDGSPAGHWTIAELTITEAGLNIAGGTDWRIVGNDISCPLVTASGGGGSCFGTSLSTYIKAFGNTFHDMGQNSKDRLWQGVYYSTDTDHVEHAWNLQSNSGGRTSLQTHSSPVSSGNGYALYDIKVHDNTVHDSREECILIDTVDPSEGGIEIYNNVVYNCGKDGAGVASMQQQVSGDFNGGHGYGTSPPPIRWYNNTILVNNYGACWAASFPDIHSGTSLTNFLLNNICLVTYSSSGYFHPVYYSGSVCSNADTPSACPTLTGQYNLIYGANSPTFPNLMNSQVNSNPGLSNTTVKGCPTSCATDLHLSSASSPANRAGNASTNPITLTYDHDGLVRPNPPSIGAYEYSAR